jgi:hypothetical protein
MSARRIVTPVFESPPRAGGRRLLLVSYHFPPDPNVGSLRWEMMLRHAAQHGWSADVLMMDIAGVGALENSRLENLPPGTRLFGVRSPGQPLLALLELRQRFLPSARQKAAVASALSEEPDRASNHEWHPLLSGLFNNLKRDLLAKSHYRQWSSWASRAARCGIALSRANQYECVISSGPPHMAHEAARRIAATASIPLITDFRDPWTSDDVAPPSVNGAAWKALSNRYESMSLEASALIVSNTPSAARFTKAKYPKLAHKVITVMNGSDADRRSPAPPSSQFTITHAGSLYGGRYPQPLFRAVRRVVESRGLNNADIVVHFIGVDELQREALAELTSREGIESFFVCETWRPRAEAMALLDHSAVLVLLPQVHIHSIPAKLFEYVQRPVWVLVLSEPGTAVAELLQGTAADVLSPGDVNAIADVIGQHFDEARKGVKPAPLNADGRFSRERQAEYFFRELERVVSSRTTGRLAAMPDPSRIRGTT